MSDTQTHQGIQVPESNDPAELLAALRDIHEPAAPQPVPLWLPAANVVLFSVIACMLWTHYRRKKMAWKSEALQRLRSAQQHPPQQALHDAATLLRQLMLQRDPHSMQLTGTAWLKRLDREFDTVWFTQGNGQYFGESLYQPNHLSEATTRRLLNDLADNIRTLPVARSKR